MEGNERRRNTVVATQRPNWMQYQIPKMAQGDYTESFITSLEVAMNQANIPEDEGKHILLAQINQTTRDTLLDLIQDRTSTYEGIKHRMMEESGLTAIIAAEEFHSISMGGVTDMRPGKMVASVAKWAYKIMEDAGDVKEVADKAIIARFRAEMTTEGKDFINLRKP